MLGTRLGFDRVERYAQMLGLGEKAGLDIPGEQPGIVPSEPPRAGGMGMMTAYGEGFQVTPLELAGLLSAIANGGTLYYLQYPRTPEEIDHFTPKVKRTLEFSAQRPRRRQNGHARRGGFRHRAPGRLRSQRAHPRQDRHLHRFPVGQPHGLVRVVQRGRRIISWWWW